MKPNKTAIAQMISQITGNDINEEDLTDEMMSGIFIEEDENEENTDEEEDESEQEQANEDEFSGEEDYSDEEDDLDNIDVSKLSPTEKMLYNTIMNERKRAKRDKIDTLIATSGLSAKYIPMLKRISKTQTSIDEIKKTIEELKEIDLSTSRRVPREKFVPKGKVKSSSKSESKKDTGLPKGKELGKMLAELRNKNKRKG